jgi:hypothetical protein
MQYTQTMQPIHTATDRLPPSHITTRGNDMIRFLAVLLPILLLGCADQSKGAALNECRMRYYLGSPTAQADQVPDCMKAKSFQAVSACSPEAEQDEWDVQVRTFHYNNPQCYRPLGASRWIASALSPM